MAHEFISTPSGEAINLAQVCYFDVWADPGDRKGPAVVAVFAATYPGTTGAVRVIVRDDTEQFFQTLAAYNVGVGGLRKKLAAMMALWKNLA